MKQFFKFMFASMLGVFLSTILMFFVVIILITALAASVGEVDNVKVEDGTVLHIKLDGQIVERSSDNPLSGFSLLSPDFSEKPGLNDILESLRKAGSDSHIKGIYLDLTTVSAGMASIEEIRNALIRFKSGGKFIYAYGDIYTQSGYYLASVADKIWMNPEGGMDFRGMASMIPFLKGTLYKLEVKPEIIRHGKFKSAVEPFILDKMSDENRAQTAVYVEALWGHFLSGISKSRSIPADSLKAYAHDLRIQYPEDAVKLKMVDSLAYMDQFLKMLATKTGSKDVNDIRMISLNRYKNAADPTHRKEFTRDRIAVIYAVGDIVSGKGKDDEIGSESLSKTIRKARLDDRVKAVVLRVNSPGGDALASEVIWRELQLCHQKKPLIVSMGDVAASGGYYISCGADSVFAQPNTITGSIGVFGLLFNVQDMLKNKIGVTIDGYKTGPYADMGSMSRPLTENERQIMQNSVERVYQTFISRVGAGRNMTTAQVDSIGQGRVWSGKDAIKIGLVDQLGGIGEAIKAAASKAGISNYRITELPEVKDPFTSIMENIKGDATEAAIKERLGDGYTYFSKAEKLSRMNGIQARFLFEGISY